MIADGLSIKGSYHDINQDFFICRSYKDTHIIVVSDGMGSKMFSHFGSRYICESVCDVISNNMIDTDSMNFRDIIYECYEEWKRRLADYDISQCYATMLAAVVMKNKIKAARLGDGFISIYADGKISCLFDKKENCFINETDCLREVLDIEKIEFFETEYTKFQGIISCTDGVEIGTMQEKELISFTRDFVDEYSRMEKNETIIEIESWLKDWPGVDDKTLAFIMEREG